MLATALLILWALIDGASLQVSSKALIILSGVGIMGILAAVGVCSLRIDLAQATIEIHSFLGLRRRLVDGSDVSEVVVTIDDLSVQGATISLTAGNSPIKLDQRSILTEPDSAHLLLFAAMLCQVLRADLVLNGTPQRPSPNFSATYDLLSPEHN
jgi:hypothetical protein